METLLHNALANAAVVAAVSPFVWLAGRVLKRPAVIHALWLLLLLKLLTPPMWNVPVRLLPAAATIRVRPAVELPLAPASVYRPPPPVVVELTLPTPRDPNPVDVDASNLNGMPVERISTAAGSEESQQKNTAFVASGAGVTLPAPVGPAPASSATMPIEMPPAITERTNSTWVWRIVALVWILGSTIYAAVAITRLARFARVARWSDPAPPEVRRRVEKWAARVGLRGAPVAIMTSGALSPMVWGPLRARLLLPSELWDQLGEVQRDAVVLHELAHLARRDHWVRCIELLTAVVYWWFPVCWWLRHEMREAEEQCCDAWVLWAMPGAFKPYAGTILQTVDFLTLHGSPGVPELASGMGQFRHLKRRLVMLKRGDVSRALTRGGVMMVLGAAGLLLPWTPVVAQSLPPTPSPDKPAADPAQKSADDVKSDPTAPAAEPAAGLPDQPGLTPPVAIEADGKTAPVGIDPRQHADVFGGTASYRTPAAEANTLDDAAVGQSRAAGVPYRIVSVDGTASPEVRELEKKIAEDQANLARDVDRLERLRAGAMKEANALPPPAAAEIITQVLPDGRIVTMRRAVTTNSRLPGNNFGGAAAKGRWTEVAAPTPAPRMDRDQRLSEIERQLQSLLNEVDKMRYEKSDAEPFGRPDRPAGSPAPGQPGGSGTQALPPTPAPRTN